MFNPLAIREDATPSFEVRVAPKEVEAASPGVALAITSPEVPARKAVLLGWLGRMRVRTLMHPRRL